MFFDPFDPLINVLILPANSLALFLSQKLRERLDSVGLGAAAVEFGTVGAWATADAVERMRSSGTSRVTANNPPTE